MQTESDPNLSLTSRLFRWKGRDHVSVSAMSAFSIGQDGRAVLLPEADLWPMAAPVIEQGLALEEGFPKPGREFFVAGSAYAPSGKTVEAVNVSAAVGDLRRDLRVTGDRQWALGNTVSRPEPFSEKPLDWQHAAGGPDDQRNPLGKTGMADPKTGKLPLPNILDAKDVPVSPNKPLPPASMLPKGSAWASRSDIPALLSGDWPKDAQPGELPEQFNWDWFHTAAAPDQKGKGKFQPGEAFTVSGMHPEKAVVSGTLPKETPWARIEHVTDSGEVRASTIRLQPDTVWLFPDQEKGIMVWHGMAPVSGAETEDAATLRGGYGEPPLQVEVEAGEVEPLAAEPPPAPKLPEPPQAIVAAAGAGAVIAEEVATVGVSPLDRMVSEQLDGELAALEPAVEEPAPEPERKREAVTPKTEKERADEAREILNDLFDSVGSSEEMITLGEELDLFNSILADKGVDPITAEAYLERLPKYIEEQKEIISQLSDEELARLNPDESEKSEEEAQQEVIQTLRERLVEGGIDEAKAEELASGIFEDFTEEEMEIVEKFIAELEQVDWSDSPVSLDEMTSGEFDVAGLTARMNGITQEYFGKDFETLMDLDDDTIPVPDSKESFLECLNLNEEDLPKEVNALLTAMLEDVDEEQLDELMSTASAAYARAMEYDKAAEEAGKRSGAELKDETDGKTDSPAEIPAQAEENEARINAISGDDIEQPPKFVQEDKSGPSIAEDTWRTGPDDTALDEIPEDKIPKDKIPEDKGQENVGGESPEDIFGDAMK